MFRGIQFWRPDFKRPYLFYISPSYNIDKIKPLLGKTNRTDLPENTVVCDKKDIIMFFFLYSTYKDIF